MNMIKPLQQNAINAILSEYEKAIAELIRVIEPITNDTLTAIVDANTTNPECKSIQAILTHVVSSGYSYCIYIQQLKNKEAKRPPKFDRLSASEYIEDLKSVVKFTYDTFSNIEDHEIEVFDSNRKIKTAWGQVYDIEQMMEHAIVQILRHIIQNEKFND